MIGRADIAALIPHSGTMCLLDDVVSWDATRILCRSSTHREADNPLVQNARLEAICGIEYAAQAMALHGALTAPGKGPPTAGYLASLRDVECHVERLDLLDGDLHIDAEQLHGEAARVIYRFALSCAGRPVLSGRAAVVLDGVAP